eukprot:g9215.t1
MGFGRVPCHGSLTFRLELGCGAAALPALVAAKQGFKTLAIDLPKVVPLCAENLHANQELLAIGRDRLRVEAFDWTKAGFWEAEKAESSLNMNEIMDPFRSFNFRGFTDQWRNGFFQRLQGFQAQFLDVHEFMEERL